MRLRRRVQRAGRLRTDAAVHLAAVVRVQVEAPAGMHRRQRVRARRDGLRLERGERPAVRHLVADDAAHVVLEVDGVDGGELPAVAVDDEDAVVGAAVELDRRAVAVEGGRRREPVLMHDEPGTEAVGSGRDLPHASRRVADAEAGGAAGGRASLRRGEEDAHRHVRRRGDLRAWVVVGEDPLPRPVVERVAARAPLAHADAVAPAAPGDDDDGGRSDAATETQARRRAQQSDTARRSRAPARARRRGRAAAARGRGSLD